MIYYQQQRSNLWRKGLFLLAVQQGESIIVGEEFQQAARAWSWEIISLIANTKRLNWKSSKDINCQSALWVVYFLQQNFLMVLLLLLKLTPIGDQFKYTSPWETFLIKTRTNVRCASEMISIFQDWESTIVVILLWVQSQCTDRITDRLLGLMAACYLPLDPQLSLSGYSQIAPISWNLI